MDNIAALKTSFTAAIALTQTLEDLDALRVAYFGKKGTLTTALKALGALDLEARKAQGAALNALSTELLAQLQAHMALLEAQTLAAKIAAEALDLTLPTPMVMEGRIHPITQVKNELTDIFNRMGFQVLDGPEVETDFNNFTALNMGEAHPARQGFDTFYTNAQDTEGLPLLLRTHMTTVEVRALLANKEPFRMIAMGRCYRSDFDATHTPMFHQIEGLVVGPDITMAHMIWCLQRFLGDFFGVDNLPLRLRPSFFPFTEPSAEVDIQCTRTKESLVLGVGTDWLEILGCGMLHPHVLRNCGIDPDTTQAFAFGCGIDRLAMLKYGIPDLRAFFETDQRWMDRFGFSGLDVPGSVLSTAI